jgi:putative Ca2+/H+ antiporter (TMEM165/GDT1 family)
VEAELRKKEDDDTLSLDMQQKPFLQAMFEKLLSPVFVKAFTMTFLAEWGDRSQIATIALGSSKEPFGVIIGGVCGHCICTGAAVIGGKFLSEYISERAVALFGGVVFLLFGVVTAYLGPDDVDIPPSALADAVRRNLSHEHHEPPSTMGSLWDYAAGETVIAGHSSVYTSGYF